ncbi:MAG: PAS domain-containing protein [candidate division Zixibacteria bacterium]|nr:PAS domain-containing protein [candidate division Zixibacteria bacterium]
MFEKFIPSFTSTELRGRIFWILSLRLIIYGLLFTAFVMFLHSNEFIYRTLIIYGILAIGFLVYISVFKYKPHEYWLKIIIGTQIIFEFFIESVLVNQIGGNFSPLLILFILSIVSATIIYGLWGTLIAATIAGLFYALPILYDFSKLFPGIFASAQLTRLGFSSDEAFYTIFLHLCLFYLIAFIAGYAAERQIFASRELRKIKLETDEILENMSSGMITVDRLGRLRYFNKTAGEILEINPDLARNASGKSIFLKKFPELYYKIDLAMTTGYVETRGEIEIKVDNKITPLGISTSVLKDENNVIRGVIVVFQNLAEVKQMEKRLRDADRMATIGELSAGIAHEIRNPLAAISGSVEVLKISLKPDDKQNLKLLGLIIKESVRLNNIITEFLRFARITGKPEIRTDIVPVIDELIVLAGTHPDVGEEITIDYHHPKSTVYARGGPDLYKQMLWNLILNSAQAIEGKKGKISIFCTQHIEQSGRVWAKITVSDNGTGIPPSMRDKIFNPFFSNKSDGTGLGLAIVARIVDTLDGKIKFDTSDNGTCFYMYIPANIERIGDSKKQPLLSAT